MRKREIQRILTEIINWRKKERKKYKRNEETMKENQWMSKERMDVWTKEKEGHNEKRKETDIYKATEKRKYWTIRYDHQMNGKHPKMKKGIWNWR